MDCPDDATLARLIEGELDDQQRERVLGHVEDCDTCHAMIAASAADDDPRRALRPGDRVGRFEVIELIGSGGMGAVYRAHDAELARDVAIKVLRADLERDDASLRERLRSEARLLAKVSSPYVVGVYDVGALERDGVPTGDSVLAMERVDGPTLRGWLATPRIQREIAAMFACCARGLAAAHDAGVIHRDFKPDNVLVGPDGRPRIGDFGLAAATDSRSTELAGTLPYLAPEVRAGTPATEASDQWSLCVALAEAMLGHRPDPRELAGMPAGIQRIVARGLDHDPRRRAPSLHAVADALEAIAAPRSHRWLAITGVVALAVVAGSYALIQRGRECALPDAPPLWDGDHRAAIAGRFELVSPERGRVAFDGVARAVDAWSERWAARRAESCGDRERLACLDLQHRRVGAVLRMFREADPALVDRSVAIALTLPDPAACVRLKTPLEDPPSSGPLRQRLADARALFDVGQFAKAAALGGELAAEADRAGAPALALEARVFEGYCLRDSGGAGRAAELFRAAVTASLERSDDTLLAEALIGLADTYVMLGDPSAHEIAVATAAGVIARLGHPPELDARLARARCRIATRYPTQLDRGERDCVEARRLYLAFRGPEAPELAHVENNLGLIEYTRGRYQQASRHFASFAELTRRHYGDGYHNVDTARVNQAETLSRLGSLDEAERLYLDVAKRRPAWISVWDGLGYTYRKRGTFDRATEMYGKAAQLAVAERNAVAECEARLGIAEVALDAAADPKRAVSEAATTCSRATGGTQARLELVRSRAERDRAASDAAAAAALALVDALQPLAGSPDDMLRSEIRAWQARPR